MNGSVIHDTRVSGAGVPGSISIAAVVVVLDVLVVVVVVVVVVILGVMHK